MLLLFPKEPFVLEVQGQELPHVSCPGCVQGKLSEGTTLRASLPVMVGSDSLGSSSSRLLPQGAQQQSEKAWRNGMTVFFATLSIRYYENMLELGHHKNV